MCFKATCFDDPGRCDSLVRETTMGGIVESRLSPWDGVARPIREFVVRGLVVVKPRYPTE